MTEAGKECESCVCRNLKSLNRLCVSWWLLAYRLEFEV